MKTRYHVREQIRFQLAENEPTFRYKWLPLGTLTDLGAGEWVDGIIMATYYDQQGYVGWDDEPIMIVESNGIRIHIPIEGHSSFPDEVKLYRGYPWGSKPREVIPSCDCGSDPNHWNMCSKKQYMVKNGMWEGY